METNQLDGDDGFLEKLASFYAFRGIDEKRLKSLMGKAEFLMADSGEVIFKKSESYHKGVYVVYSGEVELIGDTGVKAVAVEGDFAGLSNFVGKSVYHVSAVTSKPSELIFLPEICIYKLMEDYDDFRERFYALVTQRINGLTGKETGSIELTTYKPVGSYMTSPVVSITENETVMAASAKMAEHNVGALVVIDTDENIRGLITSKHIVQRFLADLDKNMQRPDISEFMELSPLVLPAEFPLAEAMAEMQVKSHEYAVIAKNDKPAGIISNNDIMRTLFRSTTIHNAYIDGVTRFDELRDTHKNLYKIAENLVGSSRLTYDVLPVISSIHLSIQKKVYRLTAEKFIEDTGFDITKVKHTLIIMGSGGRREMMLDPDQDNGFIFSDDVTDGQIEKFLEFGKYFTDNLEYVGYKKCPGNVMVTNPDMSMRLSGWKNKVKNWVDESGGKSILWSNIVFDYDGLIGDEKLVWNLREYINKKISQKPIFLIYMLENDFNQRKPINLFGRFITEKDGEHAGKMNMKVAALAFIVDVTRAFILRSGLNDLNTIERLSHLKRRKVLSEEIVAQTQDAYETLVDIVLNEQIRQAREGEPVSKYVDPHKLSLYNQEKLRKALNHMSKYLSIGLRIFKGHP
jgi:CBS domain-containing protein